MQQLLLGLGGYLFILLLSVLMSLTELRLPMVHYSRTPTEPTPGNVGTDSETIFLQARQMLDQKAVERGAQPTYYPILLNASGMMVRDSCSELTCEGSVHHAHHSALVPCHLQVLLQSRCDVALSAMLTELLCKGADITLLPPCSQSSLLAPSGSSCTPRPWS